MIEVNAGLPQASSARTVPDFALFPGDIPAPPKKYASPARFITRFVRFPAVHKKSSELVVGGERCGHHPCTSTAGIPPRVALHLYHLKFFELARSDEEVLLRGPHHNVEEHRPLLFETGCLVCFVAGEDAESIHIGLALFQSVGDDLNVAIDGHREW